MCEEQGVGYLDLEGNARIAFGGVFIERVVADKPVAQQRELKSLFKPKSAQVLRAMLRELMPDVEAALQQAAGRQQHPQVARPDPSEGERDPRDPDRSGPATRTTSRWLRSTKPSPETSVRCSVLNDP